MQAAARHLWRGICGEAPVACGRVGVCYMFATKGKEKGGEDGKVGKSKDGKTNIPDPEENDEIWWKGKGSKDKGGTDGTSGTGVGVWASAGKPLAL